MKTQYDIYTSAQAAAGSTLDVSSAFELERTALETFESQEQDPADWELWKATFTSLRNTFQNLRKVKAPSQVAADGKAVQVTPAGKV